MIISYTVPPIFERLLFPLTINARLRDGFAPVHLQSVFQKLLVLDRSQPRRSSLIKHLVTYSLFHRYLDINYNLLKTQRKVK